MITRLCDHCQDLYEAESRYLNRGQGRFCSQSCATRFRRPAASAPNVICSYCETPFYKAITRQKGSKSGLFFCCREHKDLAQRLGGIAEIMPSHYGTGEGKHDYRERALSHYQKQCAKCGYDRIPEILEVNHIDCDRSNNDISNLEILCPTCHAAYHFTTKTGKWNHL